MRIPHRNAFTLVEVLVVLGIVVILAGLLLPAIGMARKSSQATSSQSNLKQWGAATINYTTVNKDRLPWEGNPLASDMELNLLEKSFWANGVAELAGERPYAQFTQAAITGIEILPSPSSRASIWTDPGAVANPSAPWVTGGGQSFYFNYVPNSRLNDSVAAQVGPDREKVISIVQITDSASTVLMSEVRTTADELAGGDPYRNEPLDLCQTDWRAFPNRHFEGGHVVFADGHVAHILSEIATRSAQGSRDPNQTDGDWNKPKLIWNPKGTAPY
ncbi:MAG: prepilin-type N-terminal cleavage/methylation domain-containing protein [Phycisphaerales bacterium]|nr:prepilin-type N-terminal cleavage/methylation domain-containing protein [Phycisphaerales bacterium]